MRSTAEVTVPTLDLDGIQRVLQDAPVSVAILYGSHARSEATERSDVDVAVGFDESLSSVERTRARLDLIDRLQASLDAGAVDVVPLSAASDSLLREIHEDGVLLVGAEADVAAFGEPDRPDDTHDERMAEFDDLLGDIRRVV